MSSLPKSYRKISVHKLSADFRDATHIINSQLPSAAELKSNQCIVKNIYLGINASDINYTNGKYLPGVKPPFDAGFEAVGTVVAISSNNTSNIKLHDTVAYTQYGAFSEYIVINCKSVVKFNTKPQPQLLPLLVSGLTASIALEQTGELDLSSTTPKKQKIILVTAAAGATGLFAVQISKLLGHHVIGTVSTDDKAATLKSLGCDRVINYKTESLQHVLKSEYKRGVDIVYESVGGDMYDTCVRNLAQYGKLIVIGFVSGYADGSGWKTGKQAQNIDIKPYILGKSASIRGFFLNDYAKEWNRHAQLLQQWISRGQLKSIVDKTKFNGLESVADAIDYMYKGGNTGKVIVSLESHQSKL